MKSWKMKLWKYLKVHKTSEIVRENPSRTRNNAICIAYQFYTYWHDNCCIIKCPHIRGNDKMIRLISKCIIALHNTVYIICAIWGGFLEALAPLAIDRLPIACPILRFSKHTHSKRPLAILHFFACKMTSSLRGKTHRTATEWYSGKPSYSIIGHSPVSSCCIRFG